MRVTTSIILAGIAGVGLMLAPITAQIFRPPGGSQSTTGYLPNKAVRTDGAGRFATVTGSDTNCVLVNGTSAECGGGGGGSTITFVDGETPSGTVNSSNNTFVLAYMPVTGSVRVFRNGLRMKLAVDYTIAGATITFISSSTPQTGDVVLVDYRR
jgi:hypothetical protein